MSRPGAIPWIRCRSRRDATIGPLADRPCHAPIQEALRADHRPDRRVQRRAPGQRPARSSSPRTTSRRSSPSTSGTTSAPSTSSRARPASPTSSSTSCSRAAEHVAKAEHIALVQAAGGTMNGTTWLDRTNYFETLPSHQLELGPVAGGRPDGDPARRPEPGEPRQPARGRQEREALVVRQPAVRLVAGEAPGAPLSRGAPVPPLDDRLDGGPRRRVARGRERVLPDLLRARTTRSCRSSATSTRRPVRASAERYFGGIPANPAIPPLGDLSLPPTLGGESPRDRPRPGPAAAHLRRLPGAGLRRPAARRARRRRPDPRRRQGQPAPPPPGPRGADRPGRRPVHARASSAARRSAPAGRPSGRASRSSASRRRSTRSSSGSPSSRSATTSWRGPSRSSRPTSSAPCSGSRSAPIACRCTRRCSTTRASSTGCWPLPGGHGRRRSSRSPRRRFRPDNRLVLTYLPEAPPADSDAVDAEAARGRRRGGGGMTAGRPARRAGRRRAADAGHAASVRLPGRRDRRARQRADRPRRRPARSAAGLGQPRAADRRGRRAAQPPAARRCSRRVP